MSLAHRLVAAAAWRWQYAKRQMWEDAMPDRLWLARAFRRAFGRSIDLRSPRTFNEKLIWLMLYDRRPIMSRLADKYAVRQYVAERIGPSMLNGLIGVWDHPHAIDFHALPDCFVLKPTSGSGMTIICRDRAALDGPATIAQLRRWMFRSYYWRSREWAYKHIPPRIIAERLLIDPEHGVPPDYKFFCFGGEPRYIQVDTDRFTKHRRDIYDADWHHVPVAYVYPNIGHLMPRPSALASMMETARALAQSFPFVRVDLYSVQGRTIFGEMTWYPEAGLGHFTPTHYDAEWGALIQLPQRQRLVHF